MFGDRDAPGPEEESQLTSFLCISFYQVITLWNQTNAFVFGRFNTSRIAPEKNKKNKKQKKNEERKKERKEKKRPYHHLY
jgi:hydroxylamine reductase (hybrid-cluster protein)